jgi:hypothetical protein
MKHKVIIGLVMIGVIAAAGGAYAATQNAGPTSRQAFLNDVAKRLNITPQQLKSAFQGAFADRLDALVAAGRLTKAQADAIKKNAKQAGVGSLGYGPAFFPGFMHPRFFLPGGAPGLPGPAFRRALPVPPGQAIPVPPGKAPWFRGGIPGPPGLAFGFGLLGDFGGAGDAAVRYLGITRAKLASELRSGKSLAQIAKDNGKTAAGLQSAVEGAITARLDKAVASKRITQAQAKAIESRISAVLGAVINRTPPKLPPMLKLRHGAARAWAVPLPVPGAAVVPAPGAALSHA